MHRAPDGLLAHRGYFGSLVPLPARQASPTLGPKGSQEVLRRLITCRFGTQLRWLVPQNSRACSSSRIWRTTGYRCGTGPFPQRWRSWPKPPTRRVLRYATAKLLRDEAESMLPNIDREQVRKLAGL